MNQNPYAPPASEYIASGATAMGSPQPWDIGEVLQMGWDITKANWPLLVTAMLISQFAPHVVAQLPTVLQVLGVLEPDPVLDGALAGGSILIALVSNAFFLPGQLRIFLALSRGQSAELGLLFSGADRFFPILGLSVLTWLGTVLGMLLCFAPGIILMVAWWFGQYFVVDQALGPIKSISASWELTRGHRLNLFVLGLLSLLLYMSGALMCCVGSFVTLPMCFLASTVVYLRLTGQVSRDGPVAPNELAPPAPGVAPGNPGPF